MLSPPSWCRWTVVLRYRFSGARVYFRDCGVCICMGDSVDMHMTQRSVGTVQELRDKCLVATSKVESDANLADGLTKALPNYKFQQHLVAVGGSRKGNFERQA